MASHLSHIPWEELTEEQKDYIDREGGPFVHIHPMGVCVFTSYNELRDFADFIFNDFDGNKSRAVIYHCGEYT